MLGPRRVRDHEDVNPEPDNPAAGHNPKHGPIVRGGSAGWRRAVKIGREYNTRHGLI